MKYYFYFLLIAFIFSSCKNYKNPLVGMWIEKDNYNNPSIFNVDKDFYKYYHIGDTSMDIYKIKGDSFLYSQYHQLAILKFEIEQNELRFINPDNDSVVSTYLKNDFGNYINFLNKNLNTNICLPRVNNDYLTWGMEDISIYLDNTLVKAKSILIGKNHNDLDTNLFIDIIKLKSKYRDFDRTVMLYIDSSIIYSDYCLLTTELRKANQRRIANVSIDNSDKLNGLYSILPPYEGFLPDSIIEIMPPRPYFPEIVTTDFTKYNFLYGVYVDRLEMDNKKILKDKLLENLKSRIENNNELIVLVHFDGNTSYNEYLELITEMRSVYYDLRKEFSLKTFGTADYENLNNEDYDAIREKYPIKILEIDKNKYKEYINYAL